MTSFSDQVAAAVVVAVACEQLQLLAAVATVAVDDGAAADDGVAVADDAADVEAADAAAVDDDGVVDAGGVVLGLLGLQWAVDDGLSHNC